MSGDAKFFLGVAVAAVLVVAGIVVFSSHKSSSKVSADSLDYSIGHKLGPDSAPVKIVEFGDFQCPACMSARENFETVQKNNGDKVQLIFRHFPLPQHKNGLKSSLAAEAAGKQNKFWPMYDLLYINQTQWEQLDDPTDTYVNYAKQLDLNTDQFKKDMADSATKKAVTDDSNYGQALGVNETPTFYVNKVQYTGGRSVADWQKLVDQAAATTK